MATRELPLIRPLLPVLFWVLALSLQAQTADTTLLNEARTHWRKGRCKDVERILTPLLQRTPPPSDAALMRAQCRLANDQAEQGMRDLQDILQNDPGHVPTWLFRAELYNGLRMFDRAESDLDSALVHVRDTSDRVEALNQRAWNRLSMRRLDGCISDSEEALRLDTVSQPALSHLSLAYSEKGDTARAFAVTRRLLRVDPKEPVHWHNAGFMLGKWGQYAEALRDFDEAERLGMKSNALYNNRGYAKLGLGDLRGARKDVERSLSMDDTNSYAYRNLALIEIAQGRTDAACTAIEKALSLGFQRTYGDELNTLRRTHCK